MNQITSYKHTIYISHGTILCREHIGSVFYLISTNRLDNKLFIVKHSDLLVSVLSHNVHTTLDNAFFHIYRTRTDYNTHSFLRVCELSTDFNIRFLEKTLLLEYGFFSQVEWRYIRYSFFQLWFSATVVHSRFFDLNLRHYSFFSSFLNLRHGHFLVLSSKFKNISTSSFFLGVFYLSLFLSRSRNEENTYEDDFFDYEDYTNIEQTTDSYVGHDSTSLDVDFDAHYSVEEQLNLSGFFFDNNLCSMSSFCDYMSFSYINFYEQLCSFISSYHLFFISRSLYYFFFFSFYIYVTSTLLFKHSNLYSFHYFLSDYLFNYEHI